MNRSFLHWLDKEVQIWEEENMISAYQAHLIRDRTENAYRQAKRRYLKLVFITIGSIVGLMMALKVLTWVY